MRQYNVLSLFSGCGGMDLGFKQAGYHTVFATDVWDVACETLRLNKAADTVVCEDVRNLDFKQYAGIVDVVIGGPPCPPYSQTRHYLTEKVGGFDDEKAGFCVPEYFRAISEIRPKVFMFENVDGFTFKTYKEPLEFVQKESEKLGYNITYKVVNAANYGVPQTRKRFICIGIKKELGTFVFPKETHSEKDEIGKQKWVTCGDVMSDLDNITEEEMLQRPGSKDYNLLLQIPAGDNYLFFTEKRGHPNPVFKWKSRYWTFLLKLSPNRPSWTIQASFSNNQGPFHWKNRFLRIDEIKRIQTIDDDYILKGDMKEQWRQIGNAVPSKLAYVFAEQIKKYL
ncbi:MAG: DNA cytosine methyltransferase [Paludibacteraceae bacterium]|nr:DNA cytosine methyltransferase [Paludibacteraceae bacterium]